LYPSSSLIPCMMAHHTFDGGPPGTVRQWSMEGEFNPVPKFGL
jgi:hypothetical protein